MWEIAAALFHPGNRSRVLVEKGREKSGVQASIPTPNYHSLLFSSTATNCIIVLWHVWRGGRVVRLRQGNKTACQTRYGNATYQSRVLARQGITSKAIGAGDTQQGVLGRVGSQVLLTAAGENKEPTTP